MLCFRFRFERVFFRLDNYPMLTEYTDQNCTKYKTMIALTKTLHFFHYSTSLNSLTQKYNASVSQSIHLQLSPGCHFKVCLDKSRTTTFCRRGYGLKENDSGIYFYRIIIPGFEGVVRGKQLHDCIYMWRRFFIGGKL